MTFFRLLYARVGRPDEPADGTKVMMSIDQMVEYVYEQLAIGSRLQVCCTHYCRQTWVT